MKNIPWKGIFIGCVIMVVLVIAKSGVTAGMAAYYGGASALSRIMADPWTYVGIAAALIGLVSGVMWRKKKAVAD